MKIYKYENEEEMLQIIDKSTKEGFVLTNISNIEDGNFLGFTEIEKAPKQEMLIEQRIECIQTSIDMILLKQEGII